MSTSDNENNNVENMVGNNSQPSFSVQNNSSDVSNINSRIASGRNNISAKPNSTQISSTSGSDLDNDNNSSLGKKDGLENKDGLNTSNDKDSSLKNKDGSEDGSLKNPEDDKLKEELVKNEEKAMKAEKRADRMDTARTMLDSDRTAAQKAKAIAQKKVKQKLNKIPLKYKLIVLGIAACFFIFVIGIIGIIAYIADSHPFLAAITGFDFDGFDTNISVSDGSYSSGGGYSSGTGFTGCSYKVDDVELSNIKVRLLDNNFNSISNELLDFDKYVLGVAYQENSSTEQAFKAQVIAARSYALTRGSKMGGNLKITNENGVSVINIRQTTNDQAYCDPDKGYPSNSCGSGKSALPADSKYRKWANEVAGEVLVDSNGNVVYTSYRNSFGSSCTEGTCMSQSAATDWEKSGNSYKDILLKAYSKLASTVTRSCKSVSISESANKDAENWKQYEGEWASKVISTDTISKSGCALTSVSIQIARSGAKTNVTGNFNPGTFMEEHKKNGGFSGNLLVWNVTDVAPDFISVTPGLGEKLCGSINEKATAIGKRVANGEYVVLGVVKSSGAGVTHYVAVNYATDSAIYIFDPGKANNGNVFDSYPAMTNSSDCFQVVSYKVGG